MSWIRTFTGRKARPLNLQPDHVCIEDIAHALSGRGRFGCHTSVFYSVASHSVFVAGQLSQYGPMAQLAGLMHDRGEAYMPDFPSPVKHAYHVEIVGHGLVNVAEAERIMCRSIDKALGIEFPSWVDSLVKHADLVALTTEARDLMNDTCEEWGVDLPPPSPIVLTEVMPAQAEREFLMMYAHLRSELDD